MRRLTPGEQLGSYVVERLLGQGASGEIVLARHAHIGHHVALKVLKSELATDPKVVERFLREAKAVGRLDHPHVVKVTDFGVHAGRPFLVMEHLEGRPLDVVIASRGPLPIGEAIQLWLPIAEAVSAAHASGVVHRDLKPANVFLDRSARGPETRPVVLDFGVSKVLDAIDITHSAAIMGTPTHAAPEQLLSSKTVDARADQYGLGAVLFEMLTGRPPYDVSSFFALIEAQTAGPPPRLGALRPDAPQAVEAALARALTLAPEGRFPDVESFAAALAPHVSPASSAPSDPASGVVPLGATPEPDPRRAPASGAPLEPRSGAVPIDDVAPASGATRLDPASGAVPVDAFAATAEMPSLAGVEGPAQADALGASPPATAPVVAAPARARAPSLEPSVVAHAADPPDLPVRRGPFLALAAVLLVVLGALAAFFLLG